MSEHLLLLVWLLPLLLAPFALRYSGRWPMILAPLPALLSVVMLPRDITLEVSWLMLGSQFGLDAYARVFLLFSALLWLVAGLQVGPNLRTDPGVGRFRLLFLLTMAGNFWLIVAQDMVNFYLGFALMGLAAYGLVIHNGKPASLHAGRVYLVMTLIAETALFAALLLIYRHTDSLAPIPSQLMGLSDWAIGLLVFSLGIKAGLLLLHVWLPLAHPAAPVPASAVLSGCMIKAGLIGWMRYLPLGHEPLWAWGQLLTGLGSLTLLYAILVGLLQTNPKVVLAYSSVSKMGLMTAILGLALLQPMLVPAIISVVVFYAALHGLAKGALFLGVGVRHAINANWILLVLALPALVLAGAPFTAGALTKTLLLPPLSQLEGMWGVWFPLLLLLSALGTTLLMGRFLILMAAEHGDQSAAYRSTLLPWLVLIGLLLLMPFATATEFPVVSDSWPVALGAFLVILVSLTKPGLGRRLLGHIPPGDILEPLLRLIHGSRLRMSQLISGVTVWLKEARPGSVQGSSGQPLLRSLAVEPFLSLWSVAGISALLLIGTLILLLWSSL